MRRVKRAVTKTAPSSSEKEERGSKWEVIMRKFSEDHKEQCKVVSMEMPRAERSLKIFPTGSSYVGSWDILGMSGYGTYTLPNGVVYEGDFEDGMFNGDGELRYPSGIIVRGIWKKGILTERWLYFEDCVRYAEEDWDYCKVPDRRFSIEYSEGVQPAGASFLTAEVPTREIPKGYYDVGDGFYDPKTKVVYSSDDITAIVRSPNEQEQKWIVENCRSHFDNPVGARPDLFEEWPEPSTVPLKKTRIESLACSYQGSWRESSDDQVSWNPFVLRKHESISSRKSHEESGTRRRQRFEWRSASAINLG